MRFKNNAKVTKQDNTIKKTALNHKISKDKIIKIAARTFSKYGFESADMRSIAKACGLNASSLYHYFANKEQLLFEVIHSQMCEILTIQEDEDCRTLTPPERMKRFVAKRIGTVRNQAKYLAFDSSLRYLTPAHKKKIIEMRDIYDASLRTIIMDGQASGDFAQEINPKLAGFAIASMIVRIRFWLSPKGSLSVNEIADIYASMILNMLGYKKSATCKHQDSFQEIGKIR